MKKTAFMIMPFSDNTVRNAYEYIVKPVFQKLDIIIRKADEIWSVNPIYDDIVSEIHNASLIVVDISGKNPNVFYELGIAHSIKRERTIILTHDKIASTPFDVAHFRIIQYSDSIESSKKLNFALENTIKIAIKDSYEQYQGEFNAIYNILNANPVKKENFFELIALERNGGVIEQGLAFSSEHVDSDGRKLILFSEKLNETLDSFVNIGYIEKDNNRYYITEKGKMFVALLNKEKKIPNFEFKFANLETS